jgi:hypothetical protein
METSENLLIYPATGQIFKIKLGCSLNNQVLFLKKCPLVLSRSR